MLDWLIPVVSTGGSAFVGAAATDAWESARREVVQLFNRGGARRGEVAERWADQTAMAIEQSSDDERVLVRERLAIKWQQRLGDLLDEYPELADDLRSWVGQVQAQLPTQEQSWLNTFIARDHATQYNAPGGSITVSNELDWPDSTT